MPHLTPIQELIVLRAIRDANVPKFLMEDLKLFTGIVSDLFPKIQDVPVDYGEMELSIREKSIEHGLEDVEGTNEHPMLKHLEYNSYSSGQNKVPIPFTVY